MKRVVLIGFTASAMFFFGCGDDDSVDEFPCAEGALLSSADGETFCVDALEFSNLSYASFLSANGNDCSGHECVHWDEPGSKLSLEEVPDAGGEQWIVSAGFEEHPVVQVTFHGAKAACEGEGKFLCSDIQWGSACSGEGAHTYPYGEEFSSEVCNGSSFEAGAPVATGSLGECEGGETGLYDMSGNVYEWTSSCEDGPCNIRGGSYDKDEAALACDSVHVMDGPAGHREDLGFRCCSATLF